MPNKTNKKYQTIRSPKGGSDNGKYFVFGGALVTYFFFMGSLDRIINYPRLMLWGLGGVVFALTFICGARSMMKEVRVINLFLYKLLVIVMRLIYATILAWFITGILLIPLNYYIIHTADNTQPKTMYLEIRGLIARPRNNKIYYELNGAMNILNGERKIMNEVYQRQNYKDYQLKMVVHEAMFGVLIIEDWDIVKRT